ncbi:MAG TPA: DedA family protein [Gaiellales bacterium]|nr:DedA family protein [Gaiellales bacterium]
MFLIGGFHVPANLGYLAIFLIVGGESAGLPIPGETSILVGGALAASGDLDLPLVWVFAAAGAIIGDNIGYVIGRFFLRRVLTGPGRFAHRLERSVARSEVYFRRHGGKTVFFGRWLPVLRVTAAWMAGASHMPWRRFAVFNALGGIGWAISISSLGYFAGKSADSVVGVLGILALVIVTLALVSHWWFRRLGRTAAEEPQP